MTENEMTNLPVLYNGNPLDGTEFNNKYIYRSNAFLNARQGIIDGENPLSSKYREMTINEQRLFMLTLLSMTPNLIDEASRNNPFEISIIPTNTMIQIFGYNKKYYETLREAASALYNLSVDLSDDVPGTQSNIIGVNNFHKKRIFDEMKFGPDYGGLYFRFAEAVRPYLYDLYGKQYTKIAGRLVFSLTSTHGIRLLELLLQYQNISAFKKLGEIKRVFELEDFKRLFGLYNNTSYQQIGNIKNRVIKYAINDINKHTKYHVRYEDIKEGRRIKAFVFYIKYSSDECKAIMDAAPTVEQVVEYKTKNRYVAIKDDSTGLIALLIRCGVGPIISRKLVQAYDAERIQANITYSIQQAAVKNLGGYIRKAIESNYAVSNPPKYHSRLSRKHDLFMKRLQELGLQPTFSGWIVNRLENNMPFSEDEEGELSGAFIDADSLREAFINNTPDKIGTLDAAWEAYVKEEEAKLPTWEETQEIMKEIAEPKNILNEDEILRSELGMAIAQRERITQGQYQRAQELGLIPVLESMANLCEIDLMQLVK